MITPGDEVEVCRQWLQPLLSAQGQEVTWKVQADGDLGQRLWEESRIVADIPAMHLLIGADCAQLTSERLDAAFDLLGGSSDAVLGPCEDGGYDLLGFKKASPEIFENIDWGTELVADQTRERLRELDWSVAELPDVADVDYLNDWERDRWLVTGRKALFFDRDGVINQSPGAGYVLNAGAFHLLPGLAEVLKTSHEAGYLNVVVTSQRGVGKGLMTHAELERIHRKMNDGLHKQGGPGFDAIYAFTGESTSPYRAKPDPSLVNAACLDLFIDPEPSLVIGDADRDIEMGQRAGVGTTVRFISEKPVGLSADYTVTDHRELRSLLQKLTIA